MVIIVLDNAVTSKPVDQNTHGADREGSLRKTHIRSCFTALADCGSFMANVAFGKMSE